jgi:hypothetical protein
MIKDVLAYAIDVIQNDHQKTMPHCYGPIETEINCVLTLMAALRIALDIPPFSQQAEDRIQRIYKAIRDVDLSGVIAAVDCDASRPAA